MILDFYHFMSEDMLYERIRDKYLETGNLYITFNVKATNVNEVVELIRRVRHYATLTCLYNDEYLKDKEVLSYLDEKDIPYDAVVNSIPNTFDILIDERVGMKVVYGALNKLINDIELNRLNPTQSDTP